MSPPFAVRVLGAFGLTDASTGENLLPPRRKARALLAYLILAGETFATRERLARLFWPDRAAEQARASLRQSIADLNRSAGLRSPPINATREHVSARRELLALDKDAFLKATRSGDLTTLEHMLASWRGVTLEGLDGVGEEFEEWLSNYRRVTEVELFNAALAVAEAELGGANARTVGLIAVRLAAIDPFDERVARLGLSSAATAGDLGAVHRLYRGFESRLRDELSTAPSAMTRQLYADLIGADAVRGRQATSRGVGRDASPIVAPRGVDNVPAPAPVYRQRWPAAVAVLAALTLAVVGAWSISRGGGAATSPGAVTLSLYQAGRDAANQRTRAGVYRAVSLLQQVVHRSPSFSRGWSALAFAQLLAASNPTVAADLQVSSDAWVERMQSSAERALALDPHNGEAYTVLATAAQGRNDFDAMQSLIDRGLRADPNEPTLYRLQGINLLNLGYARAALPFARKAVLLDPLDPRAVSVLYGALEESGATAEAAQVLANADDKFPLYPHLWRDRFVSLIGARRYRDAEAMVAPGALQPDRNFGGTPEKLRLIVRALEAGRPASAVAGVGGVGAEGKDNEINPLVWRLALLGRVDDAFAAVKARQMRPVSADGNSVLEHGDNFHLETFVDPAFDAFRRDPRFMNLFVLDRKAVVWQKSGRWPDFCLRPGWPYDCKTAVARYTAEDSRVSG